MATKECCRCGELKDISLFQRLSKSKDGLRGDCKECSRRYYLADKDNHIARVQARKRAKRDALRKIVLKYYLGHPCVDCGEADPVVLEFDHISGDKQCTISYIVTHGLDADRLMDEIAKCEVRCANCHRRKTAKQFGWNTKYTLL
jgi:hypothetical protein